MASMRSFTQHPGGRSLLADLTTRVWPLAAVGAFSVLSLGVAAGQPHGCGGIDVLLPEAAFAEIVPNLLGTVDIALKADGNVFLNQNWMGPDAMGLGKGLRELRVSAPGATLTIKADSRVKYAQVLDLVRSAGEGGFDRVYLLVSGESGPALARALQRSRARSG